MLVVDERYVYEVWLLRKDEMYERCYREEQWSGKRCE